MKNITLRVSWQLQLNSQLAEVDKALITTRPHIIAAINANIEKPCCIWRERLFNIAINSFSLSIYFSFYFAFLNYFTMVIDFKSLWFRQQFQLVKTTVAGAVYLDTIHYIWHKFFQNPHMSKCDRLQYILSNSFFSVFYSKDSVIQRTWKQGL